MTYLKPRLPLGKVDSGNVDNRLELCIDVVSEEIAEGYQVLWAGVNGGLVIEDTALAWALDSHGDELGHGLDKVVYKLSVLELEVMCMMH